jgi:hypothetical protein
MSLNKRKLTSAQSDASRQNGKRSAGPRTARGKAISRRNLPVEGLPFSALVARSMEALGERPQDFEHRHRVLAEAMEPRDGWEAAWIQDIAILRWRLEHLQRAEIGTMAVERRRHDSRRRSAAAPPTGADGLELNSLVGLLGFTGIPDSAMKFEQVLRYFHDLRELIEAQMFDQDIDSYITLLFGRTPGPQAKMLKARYDTLAKFYKEQRLEPIEEGRQSLLADVDKEIEQYEELQALYHAEHLDADPIQQDAALLLPEQELAGIIRYESHLEDQIERKLRQFYARRREAACRPAEADTGAESQALALARSRGMA